MCINWTFVPKYKFPQQKNPNYSWKKPLKLSGKSKIYQENSNGIIRKH